ncbi:MAG: hypothetical protein NTV36_03355 [Candidatus Staskawiczbacteria bacterium]|nr:hypothetical protein [Candidatus Staskawiczbacteria bacterium]
MNKKILYLATLGFLVMPSMISAQLFRPVSSVNLLGMLVNVTTAIWGLFVGLAVIFFIASGVLFLTAQGEPAKLATAKAALLWGIVGVIVAVLAYSIPQLVISITGLSSSI